MQRPRKAPWVSIRIAGVLALLIAPLLAPAARSAVVAFTDPAAFGETVSQSAETIDFDQLVAGLLVPSGASLGSMQFEYDLDGTSILLQVVDDFETASPPNYLGSEDGGVLQGGDDQTLIFPPNRALGMIFATADEMEDDDIVLSVAGGEARLVADDRYATLPDGTDLYFLGLVDTTQVFSEATIKTLDGGYFLYTLDSIVVPEPDVPSSWLVVALLPVLIVIQSGRIAWRAKGLRGPP